MATQKPRKTLIYDKNSPHRLIIGAAGDGKTHYIQQNFSKLPGIVITSAVGVAASANKAKTLSSLFSLGPRNDVAVEASVDLIRNDAKRLNKLIKCHTIVIDEAYVVAGAIMINVDLILRNLCRGVVIRAPYVGKTSSYADANAEIAKAMNGYVSSWDLTPEQLKSYKDIEIVEQLTVDASKLPFAGKKIICVGDHAQLPCVQPPSFIATDLFKMLDAKQLTIQRNALSRLSDAYANALSMIRVDRSGADLNKFMTMLTPHFSTARFKDATILAYRNTDVYEQNEIMMIEFPGKMINVKDVKGKAMIDIDCFTTSFSAPSLHHSPASNAVNPVQTSTQTQTSAKTDTTTQTGTVSMKIAEMPADGTQNTKYKKGMPIMLLRNINIAKGLCNGTVVYMRDFDGKYLEFTQRITKPDGSTEERNHREMMTEWAPAFAMTIHKAQGLTLPAINLIFRSDDFYSPDATKLLYVALSRVRSAKNVFYVCR